MLSTKTTCKSPKSSPKQDRNKNVHLSRVISRVPGLGRSGFTQVCGCTLVYVINLFLFFCLSYVPPTSVPHAPDFLSLFLCPYECVCPLSCLSSLVYWKWDFGCTEQKVKEYSGAQFVQFCLVCIIVCEVNNSLICFYHWCSPN